MASTKQQSVLRIEEDLYEKIRVLARKDHRSINNMIEHVLQTYVEEYEQNNGTILIDTED